MGTCLPPGRHLSSRCGHSRGYSGTPWIIETFVPVQVLDAPVPHAPSLDEQVIAVPKISLDRIPQRSALRRAQKAEQLVEVPTDSAYALGAIISSALRGGLRGSLPEQDSLRLQRAVEQTLNIPVPGRGGGGGRGGLQGLRPGQNSGSFWWLARSP